MIRRLKKAKKNLQKAQKSGRPKLQTKRENPKKKLYKINAQYI